MVNLRVCGSKLYADDHEYHCVLDQICSVDAAECCTINDDFVRSFIFLDTNHCKRTVGCQELKVAASVGMSPIAMQEGA